MSSLSSSELAAICGRLGVGEIAADLAGLRAFYRAWCFHVPFDNLRKTNALFRDPTTPLPALDASVFFADWLEHGTGGTCWTNAEALHAALTALSFDARRATARWFDWLPPSHATTLVRLDDGSNWVLDNSLLTREPLRIDAESPSVFTDELRHSEVEIEGDDIFVHGAHPPFLSSFYRLVERDATFEHYAERWEFSRTVSRLNDRLIILRSWPDRMEALRGTSLYTLDRSGLRLDTLNEEGIRRHLVETMGISPSFVETWADSGAMAASLRPNGPLPSPPVRVPPSKRASS